MVPSPSEECSGQCSDLFLSPTCSFDVTESMLCTVAIQLLTGTLGPALWNVTVKPRLGRAGQRLCHALLWAKPVQRLHLSTRRKNISMSRKNLIELETNFFESISFYLKPKQNLPVQQKFDLNFFFYRGFGFT